ncbi:MAG: hypothetical protein ACTTI3_02275, partial [Treponema sp.]
QGCTFSNLPWTAAAGQRYGLEGCGIIVATIIPQYIFAQEFLCKNTGGEEPKPRKARPPLAGGNAPLPITVIYTF